MQGGRVLVSGGGIAGLTLAIELKRHGFEPVVIEREPELRREGYMMDFFGTGWDVADRMDLLPSVGAVTYPIDDLEFVDAQGSTYMRVPIARMRRALDDRYVYLRRQDLERVLAARARDTGVEVRYATSIAQIDQRDDGVRCRFDGGAEEAFDLLVGADGVHSRVRELVFGPEERFARFLGLHAAAFHVGQRGFGLGRSAKHHEDVGRIAFFYPLDDESVDATFVVRHRDMHLARGKRIAFLRDAFRGAGWIVGDILEAYSGQDPIYFDSAVQIVMPQWHRGRVALIGDACGCLTLLAGQGSHMAMAGGYVLARELAGRPDHTSAFAAYQALLQQPVGERQAEAARFARLMVPGEQSRFWLRRASIRLMFSRFLLGSLLHHFGASSALRGYPPEGRAGE